MMISEKVLFSGSFGICIFEIKMDVFFEYGENKKTRNQTFRRLVKRMKKQKRVKKFKDTKWTDLSHSPLILLLSMFMLVDFIVIVCSFFLLCLAPSIT